MRCISKKNLLLWLVMILMFCLSGCSQISYSLSYHSEKMSDTYFTDILIQEQVLDSFASDLCVVNQDILIDSLDTSELAAVGLFDLSENEVIYAQNVNTRLYPASLTKIMTAIVVLKYSDLDTMMEVKEPIEFYESGVVVSGIEEGDRLTIDQALHLLLVSSSNDAAVLLANEIGGSVEGFCQMMNEEAKLIGATNTNFVNPHGLHNDNNYTTTYDLYLMFQEALTYSKFNDITSMISYETVGRDIEGNEKVFTASTTNQYYKGVYEAPTNITIASSKTGTTTKSGHCLIIHAKDTSDRSYIAVILNSPEREFIYKKMTELLLEI